MSEYIDLFDKDFTLGKKKYKDEWYPNLSAEREEELFLDGSHEAKEELILSYWKLAQSIGREFKHTGIDIEDLEAECTAYLVDRIHAYEYDKVRFYTYFRKSCRFFMKRRCNQMLSIMHIPPYDASFINMVRAIIAEGQNELEKTLTDQDILNLPKIQELLKRRSKEGYVRITEDQILAIVNLNKGYVSLNNTLDNDDNTTFMDLLEDPIDRIKEVESKMQFERYIESLNDKLKEVLTLMHIKNMTVDEIVKVVPVSRAAIYDRITRSKKILLEVMKNNLEFRERIEQLIPDLDWEKY